MPALPYNANIPQANHEPANSQPLLLQNFQSIGTLIPVDHEDFGVNNNYGKHKKVTFPLQNAAPVSTVNEFVLYNLLFNFSPTPTNLPEIFFDRNAGERLPITATDVGYNYTYLPSGMLIQRGIQSGAGDQLTITFPRGFQGTPSFIYSAQKETATVGPDPYYPSIVASINLALTTATSVTFDRINSVSKTGFIAAGGNWRVHCIAIGHGVAI